MAFDALLRVLLAAVPLLLAASVAAQDYRSKASGNWNALSTWEQDNGSGWVDATVLPTNASGAITVRSPHTVTVSDNRSADELTVASGATLAMAGGTFTMADGAGVDLDVQGTPNWTGGTLAGPGSCAIASGATANLSSGNTKSLNSVLTNNGTINWTAGVINGSGNIQNT
ncbi:MAG: hypothetical protein KDB93_14050, partial [Flavobacteriales bacterium]|nr:hypothetical protein [Flavobacteriales bacterium]